MKLPTSMQRHRVEGFRKSALYLFPRVTHRKIDRNVLKPDYSRSSVNVPSRWTAGPTRQTANELATARCRHFSVLLLLSFLHCLVKKNQDLTVEFQLTMRSLCTSGSPPRILPWSFWLRLSWLRLQTWFTLSGLLLVLVMTCVWRWRYPTPQFLSFLRLWEVRLLTFPVCWPRRQPVK